MSRRIRGRGANVGGTVRPENKKEDRGDRRLAENQDPDKRCILVMRQAHTEAEGESGNARARKTLTFILKNRNQADFGKLAPVYIAKVAPKYRDSYANEMTFRDDPRRWSDVDIFRDIVGKFARAMVSRDWCGCWQGNHRLGESLAV